MTFCYGNVVNRRVLVLLAVLLLAIPVVYGNAILTRVWKWRVLHYVDRFARGQSVLSDNFEMSILYFIAGKEGMIREGSTPQGRLVSEYLRGEVHSENCSLQESPSLQALCLVLKHSEERKVPPETIEIVKNFNSTDKKDLWRLSSLCAKMTGKYDRSECLKKVCSLYDFHAAPSSLCEKFWDLSMKCYCFQECSGIKKLAFYTPKNPQEALCYYGAFNEYYLQVNK